MKRFQNAFRRLRERLLPVSRLTTSDPEAKLSVGDFRREVARLRNVSAAVVMTVGVLGAVSAYMSYDAGRDVGRESENRASQILASSKQQAAMLRESNKRASMESCRAGNEFRISVASGIEVLRSLAVTRPVIDRPVLTREQRLLFIEQTQAPIDGLLSEAAGKPYRAPVPPGSVSTTVRREVTAFGDAKCRERVRRQYP